MREQTLYYANDGTSFKDQDACQQYENEQRLLAFKQWKSEVRR